MLASAIALLLMSEVEAAGTAQTTKGPSSTALTSMDIEQGQIELMANKQVCTNDSFSARQRCRPLCGTRPVFELERTKSHLIEMQSQD
jgi:hypothetical protein